MRRLAAATAAALLAAPTGAFAATHVVTLRDMAFTGVPARVAAGDAIQWLNADILRHTATARDGSFDLDLAPGAKARTVLRRPGAVTFYCRYHPGMTGRIQVVRPGGRSGR